MKTLFLIRHAKSIQEHSVSDFERPLSERGLRDASRIGKRLKQKEEHFEAFYSSSARRALDTAKLIAKALEWPPQAIIEDDKFYVFDGESLLQAIASCVDERFERIALCCHNFALTAVANQLGGQAIDNVPTCGVVHLQSAASRWQDIARFSAVLVSFDYPKRDAEAA